MGELSDEENLRTVEGCHIKCCQWGPGANPQKYDNLGFEKLEFYRKNVYNATAVCTKYISISHFFVPFQWGRRGTIFQNGGRGT